MAVAQAIPAVRRKMTEEEFLRLPHNGRKWELVNGAAKEVPVLRALHHGHSSGGGCTP